MYYMFYEYEYPELFLATVSVNVFINLAPPLPLQQESNQTAISTINPSGISAA